LTPSTTTPTFLIRIRKTDNQLAGPDWFFFVQVSLTDDGPRVQPFFFFFFLPGSVSPLFPLLKIEGEKLSVPIPSARAWPGSMVELFFFPLPTAGDTRLLSFFFEPGSALISVLSEGRDMRPLFFRVLFPRRGHVACRFFRHGESYMESKPYFFFCRELSLEFPFPPSSQNMAPMGD